MALGDFSIISSLKEGFSCANDPSNLCIENMPRPKITQYKPQSGDSLVILEYGVVYGTSYDIIKLSSPEYKPHVHNHSSAEIHILEGHGFALLGCGDHKEKILIKPGDIINVPAGIEHGFIITRGPMWMLSAQNPPIHNTLEGTFDFHQVSCS